MPKRISLFFCSNWLDSKWLVGWMFGLQMAEGWLGGLLRVDFWIDY